MNKLAAWLEEASPDEREMLADAADTSVEYLTHLARGYGNRKPNVVLAVSIEEGTKRIAQNNPKLPVVTCQDLAA